MSKHIIYQVDAFTGTPFRGNPAGVCIADQEPSPAWMQNIAMEMNLSETAFIFPGTDDRKIIRYYTPESEIALCGHATLASSHILYETKQVAENNQIVLSSRAGDLFIRKENGMVIMNFPVFSLSPLNITDEFREITGISPLELFEAEQGWFLALLGSESEVRELQPDLSKMRNSKFGQMIVTAKSDDPEFDFCVRCFVPGLGINEDPVTGSAHCALAPFWAARTGRTDFMSHQVSKREGILRISLKDNRVDIGGKAVTIFKAELYA
jgi:PhzF family phenazine biosynthesis protein